MNVITTALNDRPVQNRTLLPQPRSAPVLGRSNVKTPANEGLYQMTRSWPQGVRQISGTRPPQPSSADWQSAVSPAGSRLGGRTCQPRCHPADTLKKTALGINLSPGAKNVFIRKGVMVLTYFRPLPLQSRPVVWPQTGGCWTGCPILRLNTATSPPGLPGQSASWRCDPDKSWGGGW